MNGRNRKRKKKKNKTGGNMNEKISQGEKIENNLLPREDFFFFPLSLAVIPLALLWHYRPK